MQLSSSSSSLRTMGFPGNSASKESTCNSGDPGSISGSRRPPGEGIGYPLQYSWASLVAQIKESARNAGDPGSIPGWGRSPGGGHGNPLQYSCPENLMDRGTWRPPVHGVAKESDIIYRLNNNNFHVSLRRKDGGKKRERERRETKRKKREREKE